MRHASTICHAPAALSTPHPCLRSFPVKLRSERDSVAATDRKFDESLPFPTIEREREREKEIFRSGKRERGKGEKKKGTRPRQQLVAIGLRTHAYYP